MGILKMFAGKEGEATGIPVRQQDFVVVDTELTGLDEKRDSVVSIGAIKVSGGRIMVGYTFYSVVNPASALTPESVVVHNITPGEVAGKPRSSQVLGRFRKFCAEDVIVGHCVSIDAFFLGKELESDGRPPMANPLADTAAIHAWLRNHNQSYAMRSPAAENHGLYAIAKGLGIAVSGAHNALMDAFITAQVFQMFIPILEASGIKTVDRLLEIAHPSKGGDGLYQPGEIACF